MVAITICKCNDIGCSYDYKSVHIKLTTFMMTRVIHQTTVVIDTNRHYCQMLKIYVCHTNK